MKNVLKTVAILLVLISQTACEKTYSLRDFPQFKHAMKDLADSPITYKSERIDHFYSKLAAINDEVNGVRFVHKEDNILNLENYENWSTPAEFAKFGGECREYTVAKYYRLRQLGIADSDMKIAVVKIIGTETIHAVLIVHYEGKDYVLDNLKKSVQSIKRMNDFSVFYYINRIDIIVGP